MKVITSESVFGGHPDKICDQISDGILDAILTQDRNARVAVESAIKDDLIMVFGEVTTTAKVDYAEVAKSIVKEIGYNEPFSVITKISEQSPDIALGVNETNAHEQGAGDQGLMYGYACNETPELMPLPIVMAHDIARAVDGLRRAKYSDVFGPDGKCQVSIRYEDNRPVAFDTIIVSAQTLPGVPIETARQIIIDEVLDELIGVDVKHTTILINPTGSFVVGGPCGDSGLTGRKIIVDTYGGYSKHGGGAFSGKDVSKVDRSGAYYARYVAKAVVEAELADRCEVCVSYSIGIANPISVSVDTFGTGVISDDELLNIITKHFDFTPSHIRQELRLHEVKFRPLATYGHLGREDLGVPWEQVDGKADELRKAYEETESTT
jgi:S-adenosylmethionine synthetase